MADEMKKLPPNEGPVAGDADHERKFGPTEFAVIASNEDRRLEGIVLMAVGALAMVVGVMGLLGMNVFDRERR